MSLSFVSRPVSFLAVGLVLCGLSSHVRAGDKATGTKDTPPKSITSPEKIQEALQKTVTLECTAQSLQEVLQQVSKKTGIRFSLDMNAASMFGMDRPVMAFPMGGVIGGGPGVPPGFGGVAQQTTLKINDLPLGRGLSQFLQQRNMAYVIQGNKLLVTNEQLAQVLLMKQTVDVNADKTSLQSSLQNLTKKTGANILIDPTVAKQAQDPVTLKLDNISLETAVRLLAFQANLKSVRVDNLIMVTTAEKAKLLPAETQLQQHYHPQWVDIDEQGMAMPGFGGGAGAPGFPGGVAPAFPGNAPMVDPAVPNQVAPPQPGAVPAPMPGATAPGGVVNPDGTVNRNP